MPPATTGPGPIIDAPRAGTPLTVVNSRFVSNSQRIAPSAVEYTRKAPSFEPEKTAPGITVTAADCAALQPRPVPQTGGRGGANSSDQVKITERFTRVSDEQIEYKYTVDDPHTWTKPWTALNYLQKTNGPIFEFACHETNYGVANILAGAREDEKKAAQKTPGSK